MFLMCTPEHFDVTYDINHWMSGQVGKVNKTVANDQWNELFQILKSLGQVSLIDGDELFPDMVFTANAGFVYGEKAIVSTFANAERQGESLICSEWFHSQGFTVCALSYPYEGQGDHLIDANGKHWVGHGFRTSSECKDQLERVIDNEVNMLELVDPRWYHLDTAFCPLSGGTVMWFPGAFSKESQTLIDRVYGDQIIVSESDAVKFSCNAVVVGDTVVLPKNEHVSDTLQCFGFTTVELDFSEFIKAGGAAKCLCLELRETGKYLHEIA